jgi:hypothetical protein
MNPIKILGGILVALGFIFRAICIAYFKARAPKSTQNNIVAMRRYQSQRRNALIIDAGFVVAGIYLILTA